jgi:hypothetical protein
MVIRVFCKQEVVSVIQKAVDVGSGVAICSLMTDISEDTHIICSSRRLLYLLEKDGMH